MAIDAGLVSLEISDWVVDRAERSEELDKVVVGMATIEHLVVISNSEIITMARSLLIVCLAVKEIERVIER